MAEIPEPRRVLDRIDRDDAKDTAEPLTDSKDPILALNLTDTEQPLTSDPETETDEKRTGITAYPVTDRFEPTTRSLFTEQLESK